MFHVKHILVFIERKKSNKQYELNFEKLLVLSFLSQNQDES